MTLIRTNRVPNTEKVLAADVNGIAQELNRTGPTRMVEGFSDAAVPFGYTGVQQILVGDTDAVIRNKLASNGAMVMAAAADAGSNGSVSATQWIPCNLDLTGLSGTFNLDLIHYKGDTTTSGVSRQITPALRMVNLFSAAQTCDWISVQMGPTNPVANITTFYGGSGAMLPAVGGNGIDNQGGYRFYKTGDVVEIYCKDGFTWAGETGLAFTSSAASWRAELMSVHATFVNVSSVNLTGAGTTLGSSYPYLTLERHIIRGQSSGVTARANSWAVDQAAGTTGKLMFHNLSGDFRNGENLIDDASGVIIGVAGTMGLAFSGRTKFDYGLSVRMAVANAFATANSLTQPWTTQQITDARPQIRRMNTTSSPTLNIRVKASHDVDSFLNEAERDCPAVEINGVYNPKINLECLSGYSRNLVIQSCEKPDINLINATGIANHAIGSNYINTEEGYGYGVELRGVTRYAKVKANGSFLRHLVTTNPNSRTWGTTSADGIPDYMGMGCGSMWALVYDSTATECYSAAFDTHEGAVGTRWRNCDVFRSYSGSRVVTAPAGYNSRGFEDDYQDCRVNGTVGGFSNGGVALSAGFIYRTVYRGIKAEQVQTSGMSFSPFKSGLMQDQSGYMTQQTSSIPLTMYAKVAIDSVWIKMDNTIPSGSGLQFAIVCDVGWFDWYGDTEIGGFNRAPIRIRAGGVHRFHSGPILNYTETITSTNPFGIQFDGTSYVEFFKEIQIVRRSAAVPAAVFNDVSGASVVWWVGAHWSDQGVTATTPSTSRLAAPTVRAGAGTATITAMTPVLT